jgi:hypothetical protein
VDVRRATDLYAQGWTLRQIGAELGVHWASLSATSFVVRRHHAARRSPAHPASTRQILELRDQGLTWNEVAKQVNVTVSGARSRYRRARPPKSQRLGRWQQVLADGLDKNLAIGVLAALADHLGRAPHELSSPLHDEPPTVSRLSVASVCCMRWADADANAGDPNYLVHARPNVIMNDIRLRGPDAGAAELHPSVGFPELH